MSDEDLPDFERFDQRIGEFHYKSPKSIFERSGHRFA